MGISARLQHPGWLGLIVPLILAIGSTFSPSSLRVILLVAAVVAATWVFHKTEYADGKLSKTIPAAFTFLFIASVIFLVGHRFDTRITSGTAPPQSSSPPPPPTINQPTPTVAQNTDTSRKENKKPDIKKPTPISPSNQEQSGKDNVQTGPITQGPGSALSFNQQGGVTAGTINIGTQWPFSSEIQKAMISDLSQTTGRVRMGWPLYDPDGLKFSGGLLYTFINAGWKNEPQKVSGTYAGSMCYPSETWDCHGIRLEFKDPSSALAKTVVAAFKKINVHLEVNQANDLDDDLVDVLVSKP
jgi:hypothetical protein